MQGDEALIAVMPTLEAHSGRPSDDSHGTLATGVGLSSSKRQNGLFCVAVLARSWQLALHGPRAITLTPASVGIVAAWTLHQISIIILSGPCPSLISGR